MIPGGLKKPGQFQPAFSRNQRHDAERIQAAGRHAVRLSSRQQPAFKAQSGSTILYLGLDLGTSELKALLLADDHRIVGVARAALTVERPQPLWSEQAPSQWWQALEQVMAELRKAHPDALRA